MKIAIPVYEDKGLDSKVWEHFGETPFWALFETDTKELLIKQRVVGMGHGRCVAVTELVESKPDILFVKDMGFKALMRCKAAGISVKTGDYSTVQAVIDNIESLEELKNACAHAEHHHDHHHHHHHKHHT